MEQRTLGGIIGETFRVYRQRFWPFIAIVAVVQIPLFIFTDTLGVGMIDEAQDIEQFDVPVGPILILGVLSFVGSVLMFGALVHAAFQHYERSEVSITRAYEIVWQRIISLLGASIIVFLPTVLMAITIVGIPFAIYFGIRWGFISQAVVIED